MESVVLIIIALLAVMGGIPIWIWQRARIQNAREEEARLRSELEALRKQLEALQELYADATLLLERQRAEQPFEDSAEPRRHTPAFSPRPETEPKTEDE